MRYLILGSIVVSQIGFVAAYIIFVAQNLQALVMGLTHCQHLVDIKYFILVQLVVFLPLVLIRDLAKLSSTALVADAFILVGLVYIFGSEISIVATQGIADVQLFNPRDFSLFVGVAVFSFEGVGMVIPITDAMREPHKFPKVLTGVMLGVLGASPTLTSCFPQRAYPHATQCSSAVRARLHTPPSVRRSRPSCSSTSTRRARWCSR
jgi:proton-coupled amino acid transporter